MVDSGGGDEERRARRAFDAIMGNIEGLGEHRARMVKGITDRNSEIESLDAEIRKLKLERDRLVKLIAELYARIQRDGVNKDTLKLAKDLSEYLDFLNEELRRVRKHGRDKHATMKAAVISPLRTRP